MTQTINDMQIRNLNAEYDRLDKVAKEWASARSEMLKTKDTNAVSVITEEFHKALQLLNGFELAVELLDLSHSIENWRWR